MPMIVSCNIIEISLVMQEGSDIVELIGDIHVSEKTLVDILRCLDGSVG